ncbi:MAG: hypothetical protein V9E96_09895 [Chitinophagaceae bacterium]
MGLLTGNLQNTILFIPFTLVLVLRFFNCVHRVFQVTLHNKQTSSKDQLDQHDTIMIVLLIIYEF